MINLHMLVDESYIEEFVRSLPADKVRIVEENFKLNRALLEEEFSKYTLKPETFFSYSESAKNTKDWLENRLES
jgi:L-cysteine desulfidase